MAKLHWFNVPSVPAFTSFSVLTVGTFVPVSVVWEGLGWDEKSWDGMRRAGKSWDRVG